MKYISEKEMLVRIYQAGGEVYLIGGAVRDRELSKLTGIDIPINDKDYSIIGLSESKMFELFSDFQIKETGVDFPVFRLQVVPDGMSEKEFEKQKDKDTELALARIEFKISGKSRSDFKKITSNVTLKNDQERRDFTWNSMAYQVEVKEGRVVLTDLIDPFNGLKHLGDGFVSAIFLNHNKQELIDKFNQHPEINDFRSFLNQKEDRELTSGIIVKGVFIKKVENDLFISSNLSEDPLRALRAVRFAAKFNFSLTDETKDLLKIIFSHIRQNIHDNKKGNGISEDTEHFNLSSERIFAELKKALNGQYPSKFFTSLEEVGALDVYFKELSELKESDEKMFQELMKEIDLLYTLDVKEPSIQFSTFLKPFNEKQIIDMSSPERLSIPKEFQQIPIFFQKNKKAIEMLKKPIHEIDPDCLVDLLIHLNHSGITDSQRKKKVKDPMEWFSKTVNIYNVMKDNSLELVRNAEICKKWSNELSQVKLSSETISEYTKNKEVQKLSTVLRSLKKEKLLVLLENQNKKEIDILPYLEKAFSFNDQPSSFFYEKLKDGSLNIDFPELSRLVYYNQNPEYHKEGNTFVHTMQVLDVAFEATKNTKDEEYRKAVLFSALTHDLGKALTMKPHKRTNLTTYYSHDALGVPIIESFSEKYHIPKDHLWIQMGIVSAKEHMNMHNLYIMKSNKVYNMMKRVYDKDPRFVDMLGVIGASDDLGRCETFDSKKQGSFVKKHHPSNDWIQWFEDLKSSNAFNEELSDNEKKILIKTVIQTKQKKRNEEKRLEKYESKKTFTL